MNIREGKWKVRNNKVVNIEWNGFYGYYSIVSTSIGEDRLYYDDAGRCYRDQRIFPLSNIEVKDTKRVPNNDSLFASWDLVECIEEKIVVIKRNSNPIFMLDLCTE